MTYELLLLTKSGREIRVGTATNEEGARVLAQKAQELLASLRQAVERGDVIGAGDEGSTYWILPGEVEGMSLFRVADEA